MIELIKSYFTTPSAEMMALRELQEAKRKLLEAQTNMEYSEAMTQFRNKQIARLKTFIQEIE